MKLAVIVLSREAIRDALKLPKGVEVEAVKGNDGMTEIVLRVSGEPLPCEDAYEGAPLRRICPVYDVSEGKRGDFLTWMY